MIHNPKNTKIKYLSKTSYLILPPALQSEKTKKLTSIILTLTATIIFGIFAINPTVSTIVGLKKELGDKKSVQKALQEKIINLSKLQEQYTEIQEDIPYILETIPKNPSPALLAAQIQSIAQNTNINITNLQAQAVELFNQQIAQQNKESSYSFSVSGTGNFYDISAFISELVNMQRILTVDAFSIDQAAKPADNLRFSLQGSAYYKP